MLRRSAARVLSVVLVPAVLATAVPAWAQPTPNATASDIATARDLGTQGQAALDKKDYAQAETLFRKAASLYNAPTLTLGLARACAAQKKYVAAQEAYRKVVRDVDGWPNPNAAFTAAAADAKKEVETVAPKVAGVTIKVVGTDTAKVTIDGEPVSSAALGVRRSVDPGPHLIRATAEGFTYAESRVNLADGGSSEVVLALESLSPTAGSKPSAAGPDAKPTTGPGAVPAAEPASGSGGGMKTAGIVALGVGGAGLIFGGVTGFLAMGKKSDLDAKCPGGVCPVGTQSDVDAYHSMGTLSTVGFIVGGVGVAAGLTMILLAPKEQSAPPPASAGVRVIPTFGLGSVGMVGTF